MVVDINVLGIKLQSQILQKKKLLQKIQKQKLVQKQIKIQRGLHLLVVSIDGSVLFSGTDNLYLNTHLIRSLGTNHQLLLLVEQDTHFTLDKTTHQILVIHSDYLQLLMVYGMVVQNTQEVIGILVTMHLVVIVINQIIVFKVHLLILITLHLFYILIVLINLGCTELNHLQ